MTDSIFVGTLLGGIVGAFAIVLACFGIAWFAWQTMTASSDGFNDGDRDTMNPSRERRPNDHYAGLSRLFYESAYKRGIAKANRQMERRAANRDTP